MRGHARLQRHVARRGHAAQAGKKGQFLALRDRNGPPAERPERQAYRLRIGRRLPPGQRALAVAPLVLHRGADAVEPGAAVLRARRRERGAGDLLGIEPIGAALRRVLLPRQGARARLAGELVAEAGEIARWHGGPPLLAAALVLDRKGTR